MIRRNYREYAAPLSPVHEESTLSELVRLVGSLVTITGTAVWLVLKIAAAKVLVRCGLGADAK